MGTKPAKRSGRADIGRRSAARLAAVQAVYAMDMTTHTADAVLDSFAADRWAALAAASEIPDGVARRLDPDTAFLGDLVRGVAARLDDIDAMLTPALSDEWPLERLEDVLRAILRTGAYELFARSDVPLKVIITEYVDIAHAFFDGGEAGLANAVLDRVGRVLRPDEAKGDGKAAPSR